MITSAPPTEQRHADLPGRSPENFPASGHIRRRTVVHPATDPAAQALEALASGPISVPSLYLHGTEDGCMSARLSEGMEAVFTNGLERVVMPGVWHFLHLKQPDAVLSHVLRFLRS